MNGFCSKNNSLYRGCVASYIQYGRAASWYCLPIFLAFVCGLMFLFVVDFLINFGGKLYAIHQ
jgi:hypothetical protein